MKLKYPALLALFSAHAVYAGDLVVTEIMQNPNAVSDNNGEWFEVLNTTTDDINVNGWTFKDNDTNSFTISTDVVIPAGTYAVFGKDADSATNGGLNLAYEYGSSMALANGADEVVIVNASGEVVDTVEYDGGTLWPDPTGASMVLSSASEDNNDGSNWSESSSDIYGDGDYGTPGSGPDGETSDSDSGDDSEDDDTSDSDSVCLNCPDLEKIADASTFDDASYYSAAIEAVDNGYTTTEIKATINDIISDGSKVLTYAEVWTALTETDEDPANSDNVIELYTGNSIAKSSNGSAEQSTDPDNWNREHVWPNSHGFSEDYFEAYTDIHHLRPTDISVNSSRGNLDFDDSDSELSEAPLNRIDSDSFEPRDEVKGDVARMMFYMDTRYVGEDIYTPELTLVDELTSAGEAELGRLCRLIEWHNEDPVSDVESARNATIYEYQGNRNPYIDHPEWVDILYITEACSDESDDTDDTVEESSVGELFISEYIEGSSNNKAIEIFNPTASAIDLSAGNYQLARFSNGSTTATYISLTGSVASQDVYVIANPSSVSDILAQADETSGNINFNGDDAVVLYKDGVVVDAFGNVGEDPGSFWGTSPNTTQNNTLRRNSSVYAGDTTIDDEFDPATQWTGYGTDDFSGLGEHSVELPTLFISEYIEGSSNNKAIEIYNPTYLPVDLSAGNYQLIRYTNGSSSASATVDLTGTVSGLDVFVVANSSSAQDILDEADQTSGSINHNGDDAYELYGDSVLLDSFGQVGVDPGSYWGESGYSTQNQTLVRMSSISTGDTDSSDDFDPADQWDAYDSDTFSYLGSHSASGSGSSDDGDTEEEVVEIGACFEEATLISVIQGTDDISPLVGETVVAEAVVSATFSELSGFFMQEEVSDEDGLSTTSEGIFVSYSSDNLPVVGDVVRVVGSVSENYNRTQLTVSDSYINCGSSTVAATELTLPFDSLDDAEALEGMLVVTAQSLIVSDNYYLGTYGEVTLTNGRLYNPTNVYIPGSDEAIALADENSRNRIILDDGENGSYPEDIPYPTGGLTASNTLRNGDSVSSLTGVLDYSFSSYRVIPTEAPTFVSSNPRTSEPELTLGNVTVASLNVLNLFNGDGLGGEFPTSRGADSYEEYERQVVKTVAAIVAMDADVVGLMEIENDGFDETSAIVELTNRLNAELGEGTYEYVDAGGPIGTDEIAVALLYKPSVVTLSGSYTILNSDNSIEDEDGPLFVDTSNRPALNQKFALVENEQEFVVSVNHLKSKGSSCGTGDDDETLGQGNCNLTRTRAAQALSAFLVDEYADTPTLIIGDLNSYAKEEPITTLASLGFTNLVEQFKGLEAYSYSYDGEAGYLDHALASATLLENVVDITEWHINADEPIALDYNVENKSDQQLIDLYSDDAYRMSDHDPVVVSFLLESDVEVVEGDYDSDGDVDVNDITALLADINADTAQDMSFDFNGDGTLTIRDALLMYSKCTRTRCAAE